MIHLGPLNNEVIFKKAFSDREVLENFVEDVSGERFELVNINTEHSFTPPIGGVDIRYDIFAESSDGRVIVELQRIRYDTHFDRFLSYFCASLLEQVRSYKNYSIDRQVITIVMLTSPYKIKTRSNKLIEDPVLISSLDPRTLGGEVREVFGHRLIFLNPQYSLDGLPPNVAAWLRLVKLSVEEPDVENESVLMSKLQSNDEQVLRAAQLTFWDGLTVAERTAAVLASTEDKATKTYMMEIEEERRLKEEERRQKEEERRLKEAALAKLAAMQEQLRSMGLELPE